MIAPLFRSFSLEVHPKTEEALVLELSLNFVLLNHRREFSDQARHF